ncbi:hypothetical protein SAMD00023353_4900900 [Rosellinia necatrix]|uniref:Uncharacterized protein n=1 Tax=Rosellinia necatrix TaxID=77044 RepID=A0A1S8AAR0_ROSNE|nr:hypothetical protein SAMD00023353_4900900 [Rosellinia necatrix]
MADAMDYKSDGHGEHEEAPVGPGGPPVNFNDMTMEQRVSALRRGEVPLPNVPMGKFRVLAPDEVKLPHVSGHPGGMINKRYPMNSNNIMSYNPTTGAYALTDSSVEAGHQFVDMFHANSQPQPGDRTIYTARRVPDSIVERQRRMPAGFQAGDPSFRLLDPHGRGHRGGRGGRGGGVGDRHRGRHRRRNNQVAAAATATTAAATTAATATPAATTATTPAATTATTPAATTRAIAIKQLDEELEEYMAQINAD